MKRRPFTLLVLALLPLSSAYCNRFVGGDIGAVATPNPDGAACNNDVECASYACSKGACVAPAPGLVEIDGVCSGGESCVGDATCQGDICVANSMACASDGKLCQINNDCCNGTCNNGACGFGGTGGTGGSGGNCSTLGSTCSSDSECCSGLCDLNNAACSNTCAPFNASCSSSSDCCSGSCDTSAFTCL